MSSSTSRSGAAAGSKHYDVLPARRSVVHKHDVANESAPLESQVAEKAVGNLGGIHPSKTAVFVAHGMGQQITFQTLDQIAEGLRRQDPRWGHADLPNYGIRVVQSNEEILTRIELQMQDPTGLEHEVHIYEGYWAPLTEGKVKLSDVIGFLFAAGTNGVTNGCADFRRWMFNSYENFAPQIRTVMYLVFALGTVAALIALNSTIALVTAAKSPLTATPVWLSGALFADLTTTFNMLLAVMSIFGLSLVISSFSKKCSREVRRGLGYLTLGLLFVALGATMLAGLAMPLLLYGHVNTSSAAKPFWPVILGATLVSRFNDAFSIVLLVVLGVVAVFALIAAIRKLVIGVVRNKNNPGRTCVVALCLAGVGALAIVELWVFGGMIHANGLPVVPLSIIASGVSWPLLMLVSLFVRRILIQYLGDVAAYVTPHKLDRFNELRTKIKACVARTARAVYSLTESDGRTYEYQRVVIVGHSLGSVIVYDTLNGLINEDNLAADGGLNVVKRTPLLLTFGSPLNKTAFLFALQKQQTDEAREALAAAVQPLIQKYDYRPFQWINLWSPFDIISGELTYYDSSDSGGSKRVKNIPDDEATTMLLAHLEYWNNPLLFQKIYEEVTRRDA